MEMAFSFIGRDKLRPVCSGDRFLVSCSRVRIYLFRFPTTVFWRRAWCRMVPRLFAAYTWGITGYDYNLPCAGWSILGALPLEQSQTGIRDEDLNVRHDV